MATASIHELIERIPLWTYVVLAGFFFVIFLWGLISLLFKPKKSPQTVANSSFSYESLLKAIGKRNGRPHTILLAAASLRDLPATIPVNTAIRLAADRKCLLIDLDTRRDALAHVFDVACQTQYAALSPAKTSIDNLDLWPANYFSRLRQMDLKAVLSAAKQTYDVIILNAPHLATHPDCRRIARCAGSAILFAKDKQAAQALEQILNDGACRILKMVTVSEPAPAHNNAAAAASTSQTVLSSDGHST